MVELGVGESIDLANISKLKYWLTFGCFAQLIQILILEK